MDQYIIEKERNLFSLTGNKQLVGTETELPDGTEFEQKGIVKPLQPRSFYVRAWIGKTVLIVDTKEGFKKATKIVHHSNYYSA